MPRSVNPDYARFERERASERRDVFELTARRIGISPAAAEKDYWVCRSIDALFKGLGPSTRPKIFFKGGTSLSKGYGLIKRFSEDVDIVYSRSGLNALADPMEKKLSSSAVKDAREDILERTRKRTHGPLLKKLQSVLLTCTVEPLLEGKENGTSLSITYKSVFPPDDYLKPYVEIQCGARSDPEPHSDIPIEPYIQAELKERGWNIRTEDVSVIDPERTFLEKLFAIHSEAIRFETKRSLADRNRLSRHYYDVAMLHDKAAAKRALEDKGLFDSVWANQRLMWGKSLEVMNKAKPGSFIIMPPIAMRAPLSRDYTEMQRMMFGKPPPPDFRWILDELQKLDDAVNIRML